MTPAIPKPIAAGAGLCILGLCGTIVSAATSVLRRPEPESGAR